MSFLDNYLLYQSITILEELLGHNKTKQDKIRQNRTLWTRSIIHPKGRVIYGGLQLI